MFSVYKHTLPNNKVYIGITSQKPKARWDNGRGYKANEYFTNAILKYGWDNMKHEVLFEGLTKEQAEQKERELIAEYKSNNKKYGYNLASGGGVNCFSAETRAKLSNSIKNMPADKKEEWREKLRNAKLGKTRIVTEETKRKMSQALKGRYTGAQNRSSKKVLQIDITTNKVIATFEATTEVQRKLGYDASGISKVCRGEKTTAYGYAWKYANNNTGGVTE